jgi:hypothetical protein
MIILGKLIIYCRRGIEGHHLDYKSMPLKPCVSQLNKFLTPIPYFSKKKFSTEGGLYFVREQGSFIACKTASTRTFRDNGCSQRRNKRDISFCLSGKDWLFQVIFSLDVWYPNLCRPVQFRAYPERLKILILKAKIFVSILDSEAGYPDGIFIFIRIFKDPIRQGSGLE